MKIVERNSDGTLKGKAIDSASRVYAENLKNKKIKVTKIPAEFKGEVDKILQDEK